MRVKDFGGFEEGQGSFRRPVLFTVTELIVLFIAAIEGGHAGKTTWGGKQAYGQASVRGKAARLILLDLVLSFFIF